MAAKQDDRLALVLAGLICGIPLGLALAEREKEKRTLQSDISGLKLAVSKLSQGMSGRHTDEPA